MNKDLSLFGIFMIGCLIEAPSVFLYTFADYLTKSDMPDPPEKTIFEKAGEKIRKLLSPQPLPTKGYSQLSVENQVEYLFHK